MAHTDTSATSVPERLHELEPQEVDEVFDLLRHARRRYLLDALAGREGRDLDDVVGAVVERESASRGLGPGIDRRDQVRLTMFHSHLPKLEEAGVVSCDHEAGTVTVEDPEKLELLNRLRAIVDAAAE
jgi:DNA-binding transcriptional ArsR family regulator